LRFFAAIPFQHFSVSDFQFFSFLAFSIVSPGEVFLEPDVEADEEVAAAHFLDFELGDSVAAVAPGDGDGGVGVAAHDGFEGEPGD
jgi:hypothetical protein